MSTEQRKPGTFSKGDSRINRKGRPKSFDGLRDLAQMIAHEVATDKAGGALLARDGHKLTVAETIMRQWAISKDTRLQIAFMEVAFGRVPTKTEVTGADGGPLTIRVVYDGQDTPEGVTDA
jgi:hypothetical protein